MRFMIYSDIWWYTYMTYMYTWSIAHFLLRFCDGDPRFCCLPASAGSDICFSRITSRHRQRTHFFFWWSLKVSFGNWMILVRCSPCGSELRLLMATPFQVIYHEICSHISNQLHIYIYFYGSIRHIFRRSIRIFPMVSRAWCWTWSQCTVSCPERSMCSRTTSARSWIWGDNNIFFLMGFE